MKHPDLVKQKHPNPGTFSLVDFRSRFDEQRFDITPWNRSTDRAGKNAFQCLSVFSLHA